jgi:hypothetical protein
MPKPLKIRPGGTTQLNPCLQSATHFLKCFGGYALLTQHPPGIQIRECFVPYEGCVDIRFPKGNIKAAFEEFVGCWSGGILEAK